MKLINPRKHRKGQIAGQIFIYIMAVIIIGIIALIAYKAIGIILEKTCNAERISFQTEIEGLIEKHNSFGSVNIESLSAPCDYETICFVSAQDILDYDNSGYNCPNSIIEFSVEERVKQNIFAVSPKGTIPMGYSDLVSLNATYTDRCMCITERNGNFNLRFTGRGASTEINAK